MYIDIICIHVLLKMSAVRLYYLIEHGNALSCTITREVVKCHMNPVAYQTPEHNF